MPTENQSSNTEMVSVPRKLLETIRSFHWTQQDATELARAKARAELIDVLAQPTPQPHPDPIAWMVGTAFWWTKEEAERDAAEVGQRVVGLGPMTDQGAVDQLSQIIRDLNDERDQLGAEVGRLRAQLAERDAALECMTTTATSYKSELAERDVLLEDWHTANCTGEVNVSDKAYRIVTRTAAMLSANATADLDERADILADAAYRNGVMHGYKLAMEGNEAEYQACINSLTGHLRAARAALSASAEPSAPTRDQKLIGIVHTPPAEYDEP